MPEPSETIASVAPARPTTSARLRKWAARRGRQLARVLWAVAFVLAIGAAAVLIWRQTCLLTLPDTGDPFDVASMDVGAVPADHDAFVLFRQAMSKLSQFPGLPRSVVNASASAAWPRVHPELREWVAANREALDLFKRAAEQEDGRAHDTSKETVYSSEHLYLGHFARLAGMEAARREENGDSAGAWECYRAVIRMRAHIMRRGTVWERYWAGFNIAGLPPRIQAWAANPKTQASELRRALDDVIACQPRPEWDASSLKVHYLLAIRELDQPTIIPTYLDNEAKEYRLGGEPLPPNLLHTVVAARQFLIREPERSRRVLRLAFANWLAHVEAPEERSRKPAVRARFLVAGDKSLVFLYASGPAAPVAARRLNPESLAQWLMTAPYAKRLLSQWPWPSLSARERREYRAVTVALAEELYRREHGRPPASEEALVGDYLKSLPDDGTADADDGSAITVEDPRLASPKEGQK
jgi:hypothetical protein